MSVGAQTVRNLLSYENHTEKARNFEGGKFFYNICHISTENVDNYDTYIHTYISAKCNKQI